MMSTVEFIPRGWKAVEPTLGSFLRAKRAQEHLTQKELGKKVGVHANILSRIEMDKKIPSRELLEKIASALVCSVPVELLNILLCVKRTSKKERQTVLGLLLTEHREKLVLTQKQLAERTGILRTRISFLELGRCRCTKGERDVLAHVLACDIPDVLLNQSLYEDARTVTIRLRGASLKDLAIIRSFVQARTAHQAVATALASMSGAIREIE